MPEPQVDFTYLNDAADLANIIMRRGGDRLNIVLALACFAVTTCGDDADAKRQLGLYMLKSAHELLPDLGHVMTKQ